MPRFGLTGGKTMERSHEHGCGRRRIDSGGGTSATKRFELPGAKPSYLPDRPFTVTHYELEAKLDFEAQQLEGRATLTISAKQRTEKLRLDAVELETRAAFLASGKGEPLSFHAADRELAIDLPRPLDRGETAKVAIHYVTKPRRGLYFVGPDSQFPKKPRQAWTQGQDEDARAWFPCLDRPGDRATFELRATVPAPFEVFSNGVLAESRDDAKARTRTFHWKMDRAIPPYLATLVAGEFSKLEDRFEDIPLRFLVPVGRETEAKLSFAPTRDMVAFFSQWTGVRYPWPRYDQVCVED